MRTITIAGKNYEVRGLKRSEIKGPLKRYGFRTMMWLIPEKEIDVDGEKKTIPDLDLTEAGQDKALELVLGKKTVAEIDDAAGNAGLKEAFIAISKETYGSRDEEKNSPPSGDADSTRTE